MMNKFSQVYKLVKQIPKGKVTTYGTLAALLNIKDARIVGWALHVNKDQHVPCHRVVNKQGRLAKGYVFGGWQIQKELLKAEGVSFIGNWNANLRKHLWMPQID